MRTRSARAGQKGEVELGDAKIAGEENKDYLCARLGLQDELLHLRRGRLKCLKVPELPQAYTLYRHFSTHGRGLSATACTQRAAFRH